MNYSNNAISSGITAQSLKSLSTSTISINPQTSNLLNQINSISLSSIGANSFFDDNLTINEYVKKYQIYELTEDVIALSVASHRIKTGVGYHKLTDKKVFECINDSDRERANIIREYYLKKFTYLGLTTQYRSKYRTSLLNLLNDTGKKIPEDYFGIAYYLPMFYEYDLGRDYIKSQVTTKGCKEKYSGVMSIHQLTLTPLKILHRKTKRTKYNEYWFKTQDDYGFLLQTTVDNTLQGVVQYLFDNNVPINVNTKMYTKVLDNFEYLSTTNFTVTKI